MTAREFTVVADDDRVIGYVLPELPEGAPRDVLEGLTRRRLTALNGQCPCGATMTLPNRAERRRATRRGVAFRIRVEHELDCPAVAAGRWSS